VAPVAHEPEKAKKKYVEENLGIDLFYYLTDKKDLRIIHFEVNSTYKPARVEN
jgi:hypothetical protein